MTLASSQFAWCSQWKLHHKSTSLAAESCTKTTFVIHNNDKIGLVVLCEEGTVIADELLQRGQNSLQCRKKGLQPSGAASVCSFTGFCGSRMCVSFSTTKSSAPRLLSVLHWAPIHLVTAPIYKQSQQSSLSIGDNFSLSSSNLLSFPT